MNALQGLLVAQLLDEVLVLEQLLVVHRSPVLVVFRLNLLEQDLLVTLVRVADDVLALAVVFEVVFSVALPEVGLLLVELVLVFLLL